MARFFQTGWAEPALIARAPCELGPDHLGWDRARKESGMEKTQEQQTPTKKVSLKVRKLAKLETTMLRDNGCFSTGVG